MTSFLRGLLMPDELPTGDKAVYVILEMIALALIFAAVDALVRKSWFIGMGCFAAAVLFFLAGIKWPQLKARLGFQSKAAALPEFRPRVLPVEYAKAEKRPCCGLYVRNPGYDALDVEIPSTRIGTSAYSLVFHERLAQFGERSGNAFFEAWLESIQGEKLPLRGGCDLHEIMRNSDTEIINFGIICKDTDFRSYRTNCSIERTNRTHNGLEVKAISQEMV